ncbi:MAG TPA: cation diffusion facilitator family transporter [Candidatus Glassbacteria bacterium]|nr:cation diffusion facilitator family transporter [Candidatus Glassbacteria bacterium]
MAYPVNLSKNAHRGIRFTLFGAFLDSGLAVAKILVGVYGHSRAMIADGLHSLSDLVTDVVVALGLYYGDRPYDQNHPYGHKKIETVAEMTSGIMLIGLGVYLIVEAVQALTGDKIEEPSGLALLVAVFGIISKEWLYRATIRLGKQIDSAVLIANAWNHRSDVFTTFVALVALILAKIHPALVIFDPLACIVISILVGKVGIDIALEAFRGVIDTAPDQQVIERIRSVTIGNRQVHGLHKVRARRLGQQIIADLHIEVDPALTVQEGHSIASEVERAISSELGNVYDVTVHVEPHEHERSSNE